MIDFFSQLDKALIYLLVGALSAGFMSICECRMCRFSWTSTTVIWIGLFLHAIIERVGL